MKSKREMVMLVDAKKLTGEELLSGLEYVRKQLLAAQEQAQRYIMLDGQYRTIQALPSREQFGGLESQLDYEEYKKISGVRKLGLIRFGIPAALAIFFGLMDLLAFLLGGGFNFENLLPFVCLGVLVWNQKTENAKFRLAAYALLAFCVYLQIQGMRRAGMNLFTWIIFFISAGLAALLMRALNSSVQRRQNQETDARNALIGAQNRNRDARRRLAEVQYKQKLSQVDTYNRSVPEHNRMIDTQQGEALAKGRAIMNNLAARTKDWYPPDYYRLKAVEFFIEAVRNGKADTMRELILMFDEQEKWEEEKADRRTLIECMNDIRAVQQEQLNIQKELLNSARRQEQQLDEIRRYQAEICDLIRSQNMILVMSSLQRSRENAALRADLRQAATGGPFRESPYVDSLR